MYRKSLKGILYLGALALVWGVFLPVAAKATTTETFLTTSGTDATVTNTQAFTNNGQNGDIFKLSLSDNKRMANAGSSWPKTGGYNENKYLEFNFSQNIPVDAIIQSVIIIHEYRYGAGDTVSAAKLEVWDGSSFTNQPLTVPAPATDVTDTVDVTSYINTPEKVNALKFRFLAFNAGANFKTSHDFVQLQVVYNRIPVMIVDPTAETNQNTSVVIPLSSTDSDTPGDAVFYELGFDSNHGTVNIVGNQLTYTPDVGYAGLDSVAIRANDGVAASEYSNVVITVHDVTIPVILLSGDPVVNVPFHTVYNDAGATASDDTDGDRTVNIVTFNPVNTDAIGSYTVTYNVSDTAGNAAEQVTRTVNVVDVTAPVITLNGDPEITILRNSEYADSEAIAIDDVDGNISDDVLITTENVNTFVVGDYTVTYNVSDTAGNPAPEVTRIVHVVDAPPSIDVLGSNPQQILVNTDYVELGATAVDDVDNDVTGAIIINTDDLDTHTVGSYTVTYNVSDSLGQAAPERTRTVNVVDQNIPIITRLGENPVDVPFGGTYEDAGATAIDDVDGNITENIETVNPVNTAVLGTYTVTYNVSDSSENAATQVTRTVNVIDDVAPVISLLGETPITVVRNTDYTDAGASVTDNVDSEISVVTNNPVNTSVVGTYTVTYNATDSHGNEALEVTRTVTVVDEKPVLTLVGDSELTVAKGDEYSDAGATASDDVDGDITDEIVTVNSVNTNVPGDYTVTYNVSDSAEQAADTVTRIVHVVDTAIPVITLTGSSTVDVPFHTVYTDLGATAVDDVDGDITDEIVTVNPVNTSSIGTYTITYNVIDSSENSALEVTRTVNVVDITPPVITLNGSAIVSLNVGDSYVDDGALAFDDVDGDITESMTSVSNVDTSIAGTYTVVFTSVDSSENITTSTRTIEVITPEVRRSGGGGGGGGSPRPDVNLSVVINGGAAQTNTTTVLLTLQGGIDATGMAISNTPDFTSTAVIPYQTQMPWVLSSGVGQKVVYVKFFRPNSNNISPVLSDAIVFDDRVAPSAPQEVLGVKITNIDTLISTTYRGERSEAVKELQDALKAAGFFPATFPSTGYFGPVTDAAVKKYLASKAAPVTPPAPPAEVLGVKIGDIEIGDLHFGMRGDEVKKLQDALKAAGFFPKYIRSTGYFGPITKAAVEKYLATK